MDNQRKYSVGDAASICQVSIQTLRYYDKIGLVQPAKKDAETGYRYYHKEQLLQVQMIRYLKNLEFSLDEIRDMLNTKNIEYLQARVQEKLGNLHRELERMHAVYDSGLLFLERLQHGHSMLKDLSNSASLDTFSRDTMQIEEIPAQDLIYLRRHLENYHNEDTNIDRWAELLALVQKEKVITSGQICIIYHHPPLEHFYTNVCDYEVCIPVKTMREDHMQYYRREEAFQAVTTYHVGSYEGLLRPYMMIMRWIAEHHYRICGPMRDTFEVSPIDTTNPDEYVTKIIVPVCRET